MPVVVNGYVCVLRHPFKERSKSSRPYPHRIYRHTTPSLPQPLPILLCIIVCSRHKWSPMDRSTPVTLMATLRNRPVARVTIRKGLKGEGVAAGCCAVRSGECYMGAPLRKKLIGQGVLVQCDGIISIVLNYICVAKLTFCKCIRFCVLVLWM